jgi:uncharacterized protein YcbK (DUF882 family)
MLRRLYASVSALWVQSASLGARLRERAFVLPSIAAGFAACLVVSPITADQKVHRTAAHASKKAAADDDADDRPRFFATLLHTHTEERVLLDAEGPDDARFNALLRDRVTGSKTTLDPRLLGLLRSLAERHPGARFELVSGFRSPKLNEMLRKKGHKVASHSQHSLGHAVDFRLVPPGAERGLDPRAIEAEIRALGWTGGVGVYLSKNDWFVHADVGPQRRWGG